MPSVENFERPAHLLDGPDAIAASLMQAYNAMETTKRRHFELLSILDNKKKNYNLEPSERERRVLAALLRDHDEQVQRFTLASSRLKDQDQSAHSAVFVYIGAISVDSTAAPVDNTQTH